MRVLQRAELQFECPTTIIMSHLGWGNHPPKTLITEIYGYMFAFIRLIALLLSVVFHYLQTRRLIKPHPTFLAPYHT